MQDVAVIDDPAVAEASLDPVRARQLFGERFADAGDFAFAFVGDFELSQMAELAARYIGTLPGDPGSGGYVDNQPLPPRTIRTTTGTSNRSR